MTLSMSLPPTDKNLAFQFDNRDVILSIIEDQLLFLPILDLMGKPKYVNGSFPRLNPLNLQHLEYPTNRPSHHKYLIYACSISTLTPSKIHLKLEIC